MISLNSTSHPVAPWYRRLWARLFPRDIAPESVEQVEIDVESAYCPHDYIFVADYREERRIGVARYVCLLLECERCHDIWRVHHRVNEQEAVRMAANADAALRILLENRARGQRTYSPYRPRGKQ